MDLSTIVIFVLGLIISLLAFTYKNDKKNIEELEQEQDRIKENYLTRFEKLHSTLNDFKVQTVSELKELKILIIENKKQN